MVCMCVQTQPLRVNTRQHGRQRKQVVFTAHAGKCTDPVHYIASLAGKQLTDITGVMLFTSKLFVSVA